MTATECEYSRSISYAIDRSNEACTALQKIVEDARKAENRDEVEVFSQTKLIYQRAVVDLVRMRANHQGACSECLGA